MLPSFGDLLQYHFTAYLDVYTVISTAVGTIILHETWPQS